MPITGVKARQIFDSRGVPTLEVDVITQKGTFRSGVPSGFSEGLYEAAELRDGGYDYMGKGVKRAIQNVNKVIGPALIQRNIDVCDQRAIDDFLIELDGTDNKGKLGANAIVGVSMAVCRAGAAEKQVKLYTHIAELAGTKGNYIPVPAFNVINGGNHGGNFLAMQEFLLLPTGAYSFGEAMRMGSEAYQHLKKIITAKLGLDNIVVGDEGGFAPKISDATEALDLLKECITTAGFEGKMKIGIDVAASQFFKDGKYDLDYKRDESDPEKWLTCDQLMKQYKALTNKYPIIFLEDPFNQDDFENFTKATSQFGSKIEIAGDALLATSPKRVQDAIDTEACNCLVVKLNSIGTISEAISASRLAQEAGWGIMVSHRSGETEDTFMADLAVGLQAGHFKAGAPCRSERLSKYNQMMRIEENLGVRSRYVGTCYRSPKKLSLLDTSSPV